MADVPWTTCHAACMSKSLSEAHEFEVLVQRGFLIFRNIILRFILLLSSPLFFSFTILMETLFCPGHQLKLYPINLTEELFVLCKYYQSFPSNCQQKVICYQVLLKTSLCLWFTGLKLFIWNVISWNVLVSVNKAYGQRCYASKCSFDT